MEQTMKKKTWQRQGAGVGQAACLLALMWPVSGSAQEAACVPPQDEGMMSAQRTWRSMHLDLQGTLPAWEDPQLQTLRQEGQVPQAWVEQLVSSPEFAAQVGRQHRLLLLNNIRDFEGELKNNDYRLVEHKFGREAEDTKVLYRREKADRTRLVRNQACQDVRHDKFDAKGMALPLQEIKDDQGQVIERVDGWVEMTPYWSLGEKVKVCAFDANVHQISALNGSRCDRTARAQDCGCGPNLNWCYAPYDGRDTRRAVTDAFSEDVQRRVREVIEQQRPYTEIFTGTTAWVNGPLVHYWKHWAAGSSSQLSTYPAPFDTHQLPEVDFEDQSWHPIVLGEEHAGVLTSAPYLIRYQTNRSRANRFYSVFMCSPFQAPEGGLPVSDVRAALEPDLQKRDGCQYCHARVEPAAAYWGRWAEYGVSYLDGSDFPAFDANCASCASGDTECSDRCRQNYTTDAVDVREQEFYGWLKPYTFLKEPHFDHVERGPKALVEDAILDNSFLGCTVDNVATQYLGRPLDPESERHVRQSWIQSFAASNYDYAALVGRVVTSDIYRKVK